MLWTRVDVKVGALLKVLHTISADSHGNIGDTFIFLPLAGPQSPSVACTARLKVHMYYEVWSSHIWCDVKFSKNGSRVAVVFEVGYRRTK